MIPAIVLLVFVTLQRLAEMVWSRSNERRLESMGAIQAGPKHYPIMVGLHGIGEAFTGVARAGVLVIFPPG